MRLKLIYFFCIGAIFLNGCINRHGVTMKYYHDCKEYYDLQGFYHKECDGDDIFTYDEMKDAFKEKKQPPKSNVW